MTKGTDQHSTKGIQKLQFANDEFARYKQLGRTAFLQQNPLSIR